MICLGSRKSKSSKKIKKNVRKRVVKKTKKTVKKVKKLTKKTKKATRAKAKKVLRKPRKVAVKTKKEEILEPKKEISDIEAKEMAKVELILTDPLVRQTLIEVGGENALSIIRNFYGDFSDDEIAKKLKLKISDVRATLNRLHSEGLVNYIREKDSETGWYSYSWSLDKIRMEGWAKDQTDKCNMTKDEGKEYYFCPTCGGASVVEFETASDCSFKCARCNKNLEYMDDKRLEQINDVFRKKF